MYEDYEMIELREPYIPGFLGFREVPFICNLFEKLKNSNPQYLPQVSCSSSGISVIHVFDSKY